MSLSSSPASIEIRLPGATSLLVLIPVLLAIVAGWFCLRWQVGATVSEVATTGDPPNLELARVAARWAPDDPAVHWQLGAASRREFTANNIQETVREFEAAVQLSPNDFRYWEELGRALETSGDRAGAEKALRRAAFLAPNYYHPRWRLGNLLLRSNRYEEAFQNLFRAAQANQELWPQVINLAWQAYDGDVDRIANEACKDPQVRVLFATYLVGLKLYDDALRLWKTLPPDVHAKVLNPGRVLRKALYDAKQFRGALEVHRDLEPQDAAPEPDVFSNGGFEESITVPVNRIFGWTIGSNVQAQISIINEGHSGRRSMQIVLSAANRLERITVSQMIVVQPNAQYRLDFYARTEKLNSASTPVVTIFDPKYGRVIASSAGLPTGTNGWQKYSLDFTMSDGDGIVMMIGCPPCQVGNVCPIFGTVWYDDFTFQRTSGAPGRTAVAKADQETRATTR